MARRAWRRPRRHFLDDATTPGPRLEPEERREVELNYLRLLWEASRAPDALIQALDECSTGGIRALAARPLPRWLNAALMDVLRTEPRRLGRLWAAASRRRRGDMLDYERYDAIREARDHGLTWKQSAEWAAEHTPGNVTAAAVLRSYHKVRRARQRGEDWQYVVTLAQRRYWPI
jgi:hypothetical protein